MVHKGKEREKDDVEDRGQTKMYTDIFEHVHTQRVTWFLKTAFNGQNHGNLMCGIMLEKTTLR